MSKKFLNRVEPTSLGSGTPSTANFLRGDGFWASIGGGVTDHGALTGLSDDDHPQYLTTGRGDARYVQGNDSRLSDARTPTAHEHTAADVDSGASSDGHVLTSDGAGGAAWEPLPPGVQGVGVSTVWAGSQAAYDAISTPDPNTLYFVTG